MLVVKVWGLPQMKEEELQQLHKGIVAAAVSVEEIGVKNEKDMLCLFPPNMMSYGLGEMILLEVKFCGTRKPRHSDQEWRMLTGRIGSCIQTRFPRAWLCVEADTD